MTESLNGLRFDIYERVHLPEDAAAIQELEEIELVPHIQAIPSGDQVLLKGHLLLTGTYRPADERSVPGQLEHRIPVEISLPPNRVEKLENLSVEIDNFDVDLLSSRSLNVTGVLGLRGLQISAPQAPAPVWQEDGFTVVHQAPKNAAAPEAQEEQERTADNGQAQARNGEEPYSPARAEYGYLAAYETSPERPSQAAAPSPSPAAFPPPSASQPVPPWQAFPPYQAISPAHPVSPSEPYSPYQAARPPQAATPPAPQAESAPQAYAPIPVREEAYRIGEEPARQGDDAAESESPEFASGQPAFAFDLPPEPEARPAEPSVPEFNLLNADYGDDSWGDVTIEKLDAGREPQEASREPVAAQEPPPQAADKTEVKVGFGTKPASEPPAPSYVSGVGLLSQLGDKGGKREAELRAAEEEAVGAGSEKEASNASSRETSGDEIEWARLFLSKESGEQSFRKVKLCIVQREDTLEAIATRYNVQSRELQLYNRLADPHVSEGQIIYIP